MNIVVVGGGIFGCTSAIWLANAGHRVDLVESLPCLLGGASGKNQFRVHKGFHYPRSPETMDACRNGEARFTRYFANCILQNHTHFYGVAKERSFLSAGECLRSWNEHSLNVIKNSYPPFPVNHKAFDKIFCVDEKVFCVDTLRSFLKKELIAKGVRIFLGRKASVHSLNNYDLKVIATYDQSNALLNEAFYGRYQFELVEKPILYLPEAYRNVSFVVQDGPFTCIDPYGDTGLTLMGNVEHAIHHSNIGMFPEIPKCYEEMVSQQFVINPKITKVDKFLTVAEEYFPGIKSIAVHVGSFFVVRTVLPENEKTDSRPTIVRTFRDKTVSVFSGKIPTCLDAAEEVMGIANGY